MMATDDSMSDDVFEDSPGIYKSKLNQNENLRGFDGTDGDTADQRYTPSPTGYPGYKPPKEALRMYAMENEYFYDPNQFSGKKKHRNGSGGSGDGGNTTMVTTVGDCDDGWKSYPIEEDNSFDESIVHKVKKKK